MLPSTNLKIPHNSLLIMLDIKSSYYAYVKKGALIKSYRYSHALITPRFTMWKQIDLYLHLRFLYLLRITAHHNKCVNLYLVNVKIYLIRILCQSTAHRCVKTATIRCVFKIYNVTRFTCAMMKKISLITEFTTTWQNSLISQKLVV